MKKLIVTVILATPVCAMADQATRGVDCDTWAAAATQVMTVRQVGISYQQVYKAAKGSDLVVDIMDIAYDKPRYTSEAAQQRAVEEFTNTIYRTCLGG